MALVALSVIEQRLDAVRAVLAGGEVTSVARDLQVHRSTVHRWVEAYLAGGLGGLADRSHRPRSCPHQVTTSVEVRVAELRREHPRWGAKRLRMELLRRPWAGVEVPSVRTIVRILARHGLATPRPRKRPRSSYKRWEREAPMQLWALDVVGGVWLVDPRTGVLREAKVVTGLDDHSRFCVIAKVVERATARAVCLALAEALARFGVPEEVLTDNGKQFTDRFGKRGETLFDKICRRNGITHRLTQPASPNQNGKVERFHGTFRPEFLDQADPFVSVEAAQAAVDGWVTGYNTDRPHQALDPVAPVVPADRFASTPQAQRNVLPLWLPPTLTEPSMSPAQMSTSTQAPTAPDTADDAMAPAAAGALEFDRVVPPSGMITVAGKLLWLGGHRSGVTVRVWADCDVIHLLVAGARVKSLRSHLSPADLAKLASDGAVPAGPPPLPRAADGEDAVEVDRVVSRVGRVTLAHRSVLAAEVLAGRQVGVRIEPTLLVFFDLQTRELLRTRPNPLTPDELARIRGTRRAGPPPRPSSEPVRVQRRAASNGVIVVVGQKVSLGRAYAGATVTVAVSDTTLTVQLGDGDTQVVRRTTTKHARSLKAGRPRTA